MSNYNQTRKAKEVDILDQQPKELGSAESRTIGASESAESRYMFPNTNNVNQLQQLQFQNRMALLKRQQRLRNQQQQQLLLNKKYSTSSSLANFPSSANNNINFNSFNEDNSELDFNPTDYYDSTGGRFDSSLNGNSANDITPANNFPRQNLYGGGGGGYYGAGGGIISNPYRGFGGGNTLGNTLGVSGIGVSGLGGLGFSSPAAGLYNNYNNPIDRQYYGDNQVVLIRPQGGSSGALGGALDGLDIDYDTFVLLLGIATAAAAFALYQIIVTKGRRKRSAIEDSSWWQSSVDRLSDFVWTGLEDFENKIDKLASGGVDDDEHSWISTIYNEFNGNGAENDIDEDFNEIEGLEPPMLDETWGLKDSSSVDENATKPIPKKKLQDQEFAKFAEETFKQPGTCQAKIWRCATRVAEGGLEYLDKPEGITGVLKNYLFKIGFQGALGKFWNAVLSIPEARKLKICMAANDKCKALEILQNEVQSEDGTTRGDSSMNNRLFVNPDFVQDLDQSDGSKQFDNENEEEFGDA